MNEDGAGSTPIVNNLYQGMTLDPVTGLYYARNRNYSPTLGRWINQDPAGYINGANTYQFVMGNPVNRVDPWGLCDCNNKINAWWSGLHSAISNAVPENVRHPVTSIILAEITAIWNYIDSHPYPSCQSSSPWPFPPT